MATSQLQSPTVRRTPISNNITQFLIPQTAANRSALLSATTPKMNTSTLTAAASATTMNNSRTPSEATRATPLSTTRTLNTGTPATVSGTTLSSAASAFARSTSSLAAAMNISRTPSATTRATPFSTTLKMNTSTPAAAASATTSTPSSAAATMNTSSILNKEKKNCEIKKTDIDDIEIIEEASDEEEENIVPEPATPTNNQQPSSLSATSGRRGGNNASDITADNDADDIVRNNPDAAGNSDPQGGTSKKKNKINIVIISDDTEMVKFGDEPEDEEEALAEPLDTDETPPVLQRFDVAAGNNNTTPLTRRSNNPPILEKSKSVKSRGESRRALRKGVPQKLLSPPNSHDNERHELQHDAIAATDNDSRNTTPLLNKTPTAGGPNSRGIERRKLRPDQYKFGVTRTNRPNGRIIVPLENDPSLVHEYTHNHNVWYCRLCSAATKDKNRIYAVMNNDGTFDALVHHNCQPITAEESEKDQARIKAKYLRKRNAQGDSVVPDGDNPSSSTETNRITRSRTVNRGTNNHEVDNFQDGFNQTGGTSRQVLIPSRRSSNGASILEIHRSGWEYGYSKTGQKDERIIVFEPNNRQYAKEYEVYTDHIRCLGCYHINHTTIKGKLDSEKVFIPINHLCAPRLYSEIEEEQKLLKAKNDELGGDEHNELTEESPSSKRPRLDNSESMRQESEVTSNVTNSSNADNVFEQPPSTVNSQQVPVASVPVIATSPALNVQSNLPTNEHLSTIRFFSPSGYFLDQSCESLGITYSREANTFWANINGDNFRLNSIPQKVHHTLDEEMSGFSALSFLLTGSEIYGFKIRCNLNTYILKNCDAIGHIVGHDLSRSNNPKLLETFAAKNPTEIHFVAMTRLLSCRFAIFKDDGCERYGNWNPSPEYIPIILLQYHDGKYSLIMSF